MYAPARSSSSGSGLLGLRLVKKGLSQIDACGRISADSVPRYFSSLLRVLKIKPRTEYDGDAGIAKATLG